MTFIQDCDPCSKNGDCWYSIDSAYEIDNLYNINDVDAIDIVISP